MNVVLAILFLLMLLTPCLLAFRGRSRSATDEQETLRTRPEATPASMPPAGVETSPLDYPRAGVVKAKARTEPGAPRVASPAATSAAGLAQTSQPAAVSVTPLRVATLQQRLEEAEDEARIAGAAAMRARDLARMAHGRAAALRAEMAVQTAQFARFIAAEAADAAFAAQLAYEEMRGWEQDLAQEAVQTLEPREAAEAEDGVISLDTRRAA